jgi:hypothetical protein
MRSINYPETSIRNYTTIITSEAILPFVIRRGLLYTWGAQKLPELLKKSKVFLQVWNFSPLLETLSKIFNGSAVKGRQRFAVGVLRRELNFQTCTNTLNKFFSNSGNFLIPPRIHICVYISYLSLSSMSEYVLAAQPFFTTFKYIPW